MRDSPVQSVRAWVRQARCPWMARGFGPEGSLSWLRKVYGGGMYTDVGCQCPSRVRRHLHEVRNRVGTIPAKDIKAQAEDIYGVRRRGPVNNR